jgi:isopentenyl-diphosphate Delta-isomerase
VVSNPRDPEGLVELVDAAGHPIGASTKLDAHLPPGHLHRAISAFLLDPDDRVIIQRRAAGKYHSAGLWSNTCCGHPSPGEEPSAAASRRLAVELGLRVEPADLVPLGAVVYELGDPASGLIEREYDHLFVGRTADPPQLNRVEVAEIAYLSLADVSALKEEAAGFTAWFPLVLPVALPALIALASHRR